MDKQEVAERIKSLRMARKMTQNALAYQAGVSPTYVYQLERGEKSPTVEYLDHICWGLGITLEEFFSIKKASRQKEEENQNSKTPDKLDELTPKQKQLLNDFLNSL